MAIIGIDLGTTNSLVAYFKDNEPIQKEAEKVTKIFDELEKYY